MADDENTNQDVPFSWPDEHASRNKTIGSHQYLGALILILAAIVVGLYALLQ